LEREMAATAGARRTTRTSSEASRPEEDRFAIVIRLVLGGLLSVGVVFCGLERVVEVMLCGRTDGKKERKRNAAD
jgi:hypothetical protein